MAAQNLSDDSDESLMLSYAQARLPHSTHCTPDIA